MLTPEVQNYINQSRVAGITDDQIRQNLANQGWKDKDIDQELVLAKSSLSKKIFITLIPLLWIVALFLPAFVVNSPNSFNPVGDVTRGYICFLFGWSALLGGVGDTSNSFVHAVLLPSLAWLSNIPFLIAYLRLTANKKSVILSIFAFISSLGAFSIKALYATEAGHLDHVQPGIGMYVWISSILLLLVANFILFKHK